jgi:hypothetical protein
MNLTQREKLLLWLHFGKGRKGRGRAGKQLELGLIITR